MGKKVVIVGGVAAGATAAARLRRLDEQAQIIIFEKGKYVSFANCGLPYYIGDVIKERSELTLFSPEAMKRYFNIDVRTQSEVVFVDIQNKRVTVKNADKGEYTESYDYLVLSPGAKPSLPPVKGADSKKIFTLRNIPDTDKIKEAVGDAKSAVIVGAGYIGVEMAENLRQVGMDVTLTEAAGQILPPFDFEIAAILSRELEDNGVKIVLSDPLAGFEEKEGRLITHLKSGLFIESDIAIAATGVVPDTSFLQGSGIELSATGHIKVDKSMRTNIENVYAAGDAVEVVDFVTRQKTAVPLAGPANKQGRIIADNICGIGSEYPGTMGTSVIKVFGMTGAATGINEKTLKRLGIPYRAAFAHPASHATYYPNSTQIAMKLLFDQKGKILGAQAVGYEGVDKRIDVIATAIHFGGTIKDLTELELCYAPPYSSAKDAVNILGYVAENAHSGKMETILPGELESIDFDKTILLDIRTKAAYNAWHIDGAIHIPYLDIRKRYGELDKSKEIIIYCNVGLTAYNAGRFLAQKGFKVKNLSGGFRTYMHSKYKPAKSRFHNYDNVSPVGTP